MESRLCIPSGLQRICVISRPSFRRPASFDSKSFYGRNLRVHVRFVTTRSVPAFGDAGSSFVCSDKEIAIPGTEKPDVGPIPEPMFGSVAVAVKDDEYSIETIMQELRSIQQTGPRLIAILGTRHLSLFHQQIVEMLAYALVLTGNHIFTSGAGGTNAAVIRGALRAEKTDLLTVVLPQSLSKQPPESQEQLKTVVQMFENSANDHLSLQEASQICNEDIISRTQQVICFAFHDSRVLIGSCEKAKQEHKIVTLLYLD
eukprot:CAMPEP_0184671414 /NCGR_PEP_ID=MMETSP0308-20130426/85481_1 /TAXON_ID=38269 /ORGANISM="Gloeochaete witrockiana, Strain SAG 46.84" /LENGTH=257 /DNA_ID=CAMNT_0027118533 /DNA_START=272 /DNA_END=1045 /DNA_ORIENTATION=-